MPAPIRPYAHGDYTLGPQSTLEHGSTIHDCNISGVSCIHSESHLREKSHVDDSEVANSTLFKFPVRDHSHIIDSNCTNGFANSSHVKDCDLRYLEATDSWLEGIKGHHWPKCKKSTLCCGFNLGNNVTVDTQVLCGTGQHYLGNTRPGGKPGGKDEEETRLLLSISDQSSLRLYTPGTTTAGSRTVGQNTPTGSITPLTGDWGMPLHSDNGSVSINQLSEFCARLVRDAFQQYVHGLVTTISTSTACDQLASEAEQKIRDHLEKVTEY